MTRPAVGYVGAANPHCQAYLDTLAQLPVDVTCACEPDESFEPGTADLGDVPFYRDVETLLASEPIDVAWVTLPNREAPAAVAAAVEAGVDVFAEKPMARTAAELEPAVAATAAGDATVAVAYANRAHPAARELKRRVESGYLGDLRGFEATLMATTLDRRVGAEHGTYVYDRKASRGGVLQWLGCHWIDLVSWLVEDDPIERVNAAVRYGPNADVEEGATVQLETRSGALGTLNCGYSVREGKESSLALYGTGGRCRTRLVDPRSYRDRTGLALDATAGDGPAPSRTITYHHEPVPGYLGRVGLTFARRFLDARADAGEPPAGIDDARRVLRVLDAAYASAERDEWVAVGRD